LNSADNPKINQANFETIIDVAVNKQTPLKESPPKIAEVMNGYAGDATRWFRISAQARKRLKHAGAAL
jgi:hypothetical protein